MSADANRLNGQGISLESTTEAIAAVAVGVCGPIVFVLIPFFVALVKDSRPFDASQVSLLSSADMLGMFVASSFAAYWIRWAYWRTAAIAAIATLILSTACSISAMSFVVFGLSRIVAGFGAGTLMAIGLAAMAERSRSDAWFGWFVATQAVLGSVAAWAVPRFIQQHGLTGLLIFMIGIYVLLLPFALLIPKRARALRNEPSSASSPKSTKLAVISLGGTFIFSLGIFAVWSHLELIGRENAIPVSRIGDSISAAYLIGIVASIAAAMLAGRLHRAWFFASIAFFQIVALGLLLLTSTTLGFALATLTLGWMWYFSTPFQLAITASLDPSGRCIVLFVSAIKSSYVASGAILSVLLAGKGSLSRVIVLSALCTVISFAIYFFLSIRSPGLRVSPAQGTDVQIAQELLADRE
jgi:MFS transporter, DHA1 family, inner membrane transport protein